MLGTLRTAGLASATAVAFLTLGTYDMADAGRGVSVSPRTGRIAGRVFVGDPLTARKPRFRLYSDYGPGSAAPPAPVESPFNNVVVYLDSVPADVATGWHSAGVQAIAQRDEHFVPHVLPVLVGSSVAFPNGDPFFHNVFSLSGAKSFDLGRYPQHESRTVRFDKPGVVQVFCHIHSDMRAYILVLGNSLFTTPDDDGRFVLEGVPSGVYRIVGWQERARPVIQTITVEAGVTVEMDITIPILSETSR